MSDIDKELSEVNAQLTKISEQIHDLEEKRSRLEDKKKRLIELKQKKAFEKIAGLNWESKGIFSHHFLCHYSLNKLSIS
jgi:hypothetical protein